MFSVLFGTLKPRQIRNFQPTQQERGFAPNHLPLGLFRIALGFFPRPISIFSPHFFGSPFAFGSHSAIRGAAILNILWSVIPALAGVAIWPEESQGRVTFEQKDLSTYGFPNRESVQPGMRGLQLSMRHLLGFGPSIWHFCKRFHHYFCPIVRDKRAEYPALNQFEKNLRAKNDSTKLWFLFAA